MIGRMTRRGFIAGACAGMSAIVRPQVCWAEEPINIGAEPQLFLDDYIVASIEGLKHTLHKPKKRGLIKEADGRDWERGAVYVGDAVCRDAAGRFHMTYFYLWWDPSVKDLHANIEDDRAHWFRQSQAYAWSDDGVHWHKPNLGLVNGPEGFQRIEGFPFEVPAQVSKNNNLGCPIDFAVDLNAFGNVADKDRHYLLRTSRKSDTHPFAEIVESQLYYAKEWPDFANDAGWKEKLEPIPGATLSPRGFKGLAGYDHAAKEWFATSQDVIGNWKKRGGRDIARYATPDLKAWTGPESVLTVPGDESRDVHDWIEYMDMTTYRVGGINSGAWLGQLVIFHADRSNDQYEMPTIKDVWRKGTTEVRLVVSRDAGRTWQRIGGKEVWLPCHDADNGYDRLVFAGCPVRVKDEVWFYYAAWDGDHLTFNRDGTTYYKDRMRMCRTGLATLRWDGYVSLDAARGGGKLFTKPMVFEGDSLRLNVSAAKGRAAVAVYDESGAAVKGMGFEDCSPIQEDSVNAAVQWTSRATLKDLRARPIRLQFQLRDASLYGFQFA